MVQLYQRQVWQIRKLIGLDNSDMIVAEVQLFGSGGNVVRNFSQLSTLAVHRRFVLAAEAIREIETAVISMSLNGHRQH